MSARPSPPVARSERGVALVLVLWTLTLLTVIASSFAFVSRTETLLARNQVAAVQARVLADAGIERALYEMYKPMTNAERWKLDGRVYVWNFEGVPVHVFVRDESAKIDINTALDPLLKGLLKNAGLKDEQVERLFDAIADWRDPDDYTRANGAEAREYEAAGRKYKPANAPFETLEELRLVLGITPELFERLRPSVTVYSSQTGLNSVSASPDVIRAIPGVEAKAVDEYLAQRAKAWAENQVVAPFVGALPYQPERLFPRYEIFAQARLADGTTFARQSTVWLAPPMPRPVNHYTWAEAAPLPPPPPDKSPQDGDSR